VDEKDELPQPIPKVGGPRVQFDGCVGALEDKIVQRAAAAVLNAIYEEDFLGFSYGFRPGRGAHDAMDALVVGIERKKVNYILDADIRSFFDTVSQEWVIKFVEHRIGDRRMIRLIQKWLKAGVLEDGVVTISEMGTGQGAVISPLLANIYLHYVLDLYAERWRRREAAGDMIIVRYADDFIVGFQHESDALGGRGNAEDDGRPSGSSDVSGQQFLDAPDPCDIRCRARRRNQGALHRPRLPKAHGDRGHARRAQELSSVGAARAVGRRQHLQRARCDGGALVLRRRTFR
jgi:hypothetical protein